MRKKNRQSGKENVRPNTRSRQPSRDITPSLGPSSVEDAYVRGARVETPPGVLARDAAWLVDRAGVMWGAAKIRAMAPAAAILTLGEWFAILDVVVVGTAPRAKESVMAGAVGPGVVEEVAGVMDLIVGQVLGRGRAVDDAGSDAAVSIGVGQGLGALKALLGDVGQVFT